MSQLHDIGYLYDDSKFNSNELLARCSHYDILTMIGEYFFHSFSILLWNSRSISKIIDEFNTLLKGFVCKPSIICLSKTWYTLDVPICSQIGYNAVNVPRISRVGGVFIYV